MQAFLVALFIAIGKQLVAYGLIKAEEWAAQESKIKSAQKYQKVVNKPGNTREERRRAEDDYFGS